MIYTEFKGKKIWGGSCLQAIATSSARQQAIRARALAAANLWHGFCFHILDCKTREDKVAAQNRRDELSCLLRGTPGQRQL